MAEKDAVTFEFILCWKQSLEFSFYDDNIKVLGDRLAEAVVLDVVAEPVVFIAVLDLDQAKVNLLKGLNEAREGDPKHKRAQERRDDREQEQLTRPSLSLEPGRPVHSDHVRHLSAARQSPKRT